MMKKRGILRRCKQERSASKPAKKQKDRAQQRIELWPWSNRSIEAPRSTAKLTGLTVQNISSMYRLIEFGDWLPSLRRIAEC